MDSCEGELVFEPSTGGAPLVEEAGCAGEAAFPCGEDVLEDPDGAVPLLDGAVCAVDFDEDAGVAAGEDLRAVTGKMTELVTEGAS